MMACFVQLSRFTAGCLWLLVVTGLVAGCNPSNPATPSPAPGPAAKPVKIDNASPRRDVTGKIIDAHDGCLQFFDGKFYLYGTAYGTNDGYGTSNRYRVYTSPDLGEWTLVGDLLTNQPVGVYYRPYVVFNASTRKYVLWYNWYPKGWAGQEGIAVSDAPTGPFQIVTTNALEHVAELHPGDGSLFVDDDGKGYYIFTAIAENYSVRIVPLTPDYLGIIPEASPVLAQGAESPLLFRRHDVYYALCGPLCAFCPQGSKIQVLTSRSPLGPYTPRNYLNTLNTNGLPLIPGQETWVAKIPTGDEPAYIWMADLWGASVDGTRGHDYQFWSLPLVFDPNDDILPLKWVSDWYIMGNQAK